MSGNDQDSPMIGYEPWKSLYRDEWTPYLCRELWRRYYGRDIPDEVLRRVLPDEDLKPPSEAAPTEAEGSGSGMVASCSTWYCSEARMYAPELDSQLDNDWMTGAPPTGSFASSFQNTSDTTQANDSHRGLVSIQPCSSSSAKSDLDIAIQLESRRSGRLDAERGINLARQSISVTETANSLPNPGQTEQFCESTETPVRRQTDAVGSEDATNDQNIPKIQDIKDIAECKESTIESYKTGNNIELLSVSVRNTAGANSNKNLARLAFCEEQKQNDDIDSALTGRLAEQRKRKAESDNLPNETVCGIKKRKAELAMPIKTPLKLIVKKKKCQNVHMSVKDIAPDIGTDIIDEQAADAEVEFYMRSGGPPSVEMIRGVPFQYVLPYTAAHAATPNRPSPQQNINITENGNIITGTPYPKTHTGSLIGIQCPQLNSESMNDTLEPHLNDVQATGSIHAHQHVHKWEGKSEDMDYASTSTHAVRQQYITATCTTSRTLTTATTSRESPFYIEGESGERMRFGDPSGLTTEPSEDAIRLLNPWPSRRRQQPKFQPITVVGSIDIDKSPPFWSRPQKNYKDITDQKN